MCKRWFCVGVGVGVWAWVGVALSYLSCIDTERGRERRRGGTDGRAARVAHASIYRRSRTETEKVPAVCISVKGERWGWGWGVFVHVFASHTVVTCKRQHPWNGSKKHLPLHQHERRTLLCVSQCVCVCACACVWLRHNERPPLDFFIDASPPVCQRHAKPSRSGEGSWYSTPPLLPVHPIWVSAVAFFAFFLFQSSPRLREQQQQ